MNGRKPQVLAKVLPRFLVKCPHPVTFAGMLEMSMCYLPVNEGWLRYIERAEKQYEALSSALATRLREMTDAALAAGPEGSKVRRLRVPWCQIHGAAAHGPPVSVPRTQSDPWLRHLDWTIEPIKYTKAKLKKDGSYAKGGEPRPVTNQRLPGFPAWYKGTHPVLVLSLTRSHAASDNGGAPRRRHRQTCARPTSPSRM